MKTILYLAQTVNGYIARENDSTPWSKEEFAAFYSAVKKAKNLIIGKRTCIIIGNSGLEECGYPFTVVVTRSPARISYKNCVAARSPKEALKMLKAKRFNEAIIGGGSKLATSFLKQSLIDEIWLDIEPLVFGKGIPLFQESELEAKLRLVKTVRLSKNTIRLQYKIL
jgi:dihydrofolate reductase